MSRLCYGLDKSGTALAAVLAAFLFIDSVLYGLGSWERHGQTLSDLPWQIWIWLTALFTGYIGAIIGALGAATDELIVKYGSIIFCIANILVIGIISADETLSGRLVAVILR